MKFSLLLKITIYRFDLKKMVIPGNNEVSTFTLVHHSFLIKCWGLEIDRNRRHSFAGRHFVLLETKVNERHLARFCIAILGSWMTTYLGKSCSFCLPRVPFVNCRQFMYLVISLLVLRAGYGIWLYQFLIIAYLFTLEFLRLVFRYVSGNSPHLVSLCACPELPPHPTSSLPVRWRLEWVFVIYVWISACSFCISSLKML